MRMNDFILFDPDYWERKAEEYLNLAAAVAGVQPKFSAELASHARQCERWARDALKRKQQRARTGRLNPSFKSNLYPFAKSGTGPSR